MFDIQVRLLVGGRQVAFEGFVEALVSQVVQGVRGEVQSLPQVRPVSAQFPWRAQEDERKRARPLAVGVDEAAKMLGVSVYTIRNYVAQRRIRSVRVGRRVLVPMEVLEKVAREGVSRGAE